MGKTGKFSARLHVLLASNARVGVVIRRGPSKSVCSVLWDRKTDQFKLGQWLRGRIYERRSDISPDGKYLIYFAFNGKSDSETGGSWTAISRVPYLKAVTLFGKGDCWNGGGLFTGDRKYWLNDGILSHRLLKDSPVIRRDPLFKPAANHGGECPGVYYHRLEREDWVYKGETVASNGKTANAFEKPIKSGWVLRKITHAETDAPDGKGCYWDEHELERPASTLKYSFPGWEWADMDGGRLVWAENGKLWSGFVRSKGIEDTKCLHDFNEMTFEPLAAPY